MEGPNKNELKINSQEGEKIIFDNGFEMTVEELKKLVKIKDWIKDAEYGYNNEEFFDIVRKGQYHDHVNHNQAGGIAAYFEESGLPGFEEVSKKWKGYEEYNAEIEKEKDKNIEEDKEKSRLRIMKEDRHMVPIWDNKLISTDDDDAYRSFFNTRTRRICQLSRFSGREGEEIELTDEELKLEKELTLQLKNNQWDVF